MLLRNILSRTTLAGQHKFSFSAAIKRRGGGAARPVGMRASSGPCAIIVDYDDTCTERDTIGTLLSAAVDAQCKAAPGKDRKQLDATISQLASNYAARREELFRQILPAQASSAPNPDGLAYFLEKLSDFDVDMNKVVADAGVLGGLSFQQLEAAAQSVQLKPGCAQTLQRMASMGVPVHIISVNWSSRFIAAGMQHLRFEHDSIAAKDAVIQTGRLPAVPQSNQQQSAAGFVFANELSFGPDGVSTGGIVGAVQSARDKGMLLRGLLQHYEGQGHTGAGSLVYIGDSVPDLQPLLAAPFGIIIGHNALLRRVCACYGIRLEPLQRNGQQPPGAGQILYEASNWDEVEEFLIQKFNRNSGSNGAFLAAERPRQQVPRVLSIAGSDPGGGAGVQADLKAMMACGVFGMCAVTALTAQNTQGVHGVHVPPLPFLAQQIDACLEDIGSNAVKTGMLPNPAVVELVASKVREHKVEQLVVDPVLVSTSGHALAEDSVAKALLRHLTPLATLITPNIPEASALLGGSPIHTIDDMEAAAKALREAAGCQAVLIKGGHLANHKEADEPAHTQPPSTVPSNAHQDQSTLPSTPAAQQGQADAVVDVLFDGRQVHRLVRARVDTANTHGTGCTLASAIAAELSKGLPLVQAVDAASQYLHAALWSSRATHIGRGAQRPFNHGWMLADWQRRAFPAYNAEGMAHQTADPDFVRRTLWLYAVTDPDLNQKHGRSLRDAVAAAIAGGATMVQVREKSACGGAFLAEVKSVLPVCRAAGVPLIVNDRVDVALAAGPDVGVHVGQEDIPASEVRRLLGPNRILGVTVKSVEEALRAKQDGADYLGAGAVYASSTKDSGVIGLPGLAEVCAAAAPVPVVAIGGIQTANALEPLRAGAVGVAVVSVLFGADDVQDATRKLSAQLQQLEQKG